MPRGKSTKKLSLFERLQEDIRRNNSYLNLILGALIVIVLGVLIFNYFNRGGTLGPSQQASPQTQGDISKDQLPGKYTVKQGDTLFIIAQKYYDDGFKYPKLVEFNKLANENLIEVGQVLEISKLEEKETQGTGGGENQTIWGEKITSDTYTIQEGDWLSKIAGRVYGDPLIYDRIAKANNLQNPDLIEPGITLKIPR